MKEPTPAWRIAARIAAAMVLPIAVWAAAAAAQAQAQKPLRVAFNTSLQVLDPIVTNSIATRAFGYMVFDVLIATDSKGGYKPQMLESWSVSADGMAYTFRLRPGLLWSDGSEVTAADCVASLRRWGARDGIGRLLMAATRELKPLDAASFTLTLSRPFGFVIEAIGKPAAMVPFMMPARLAATDPTRPVPEIVGSGPYLFNKDEWRPGELAVFRRNPRYLPRSEPADGLAGGKRVYFERVEFVNLPDAATRAAALQSGEVDYLEALPPDFVRAFRSNRNIVLIAPPPRAQTVGAVTLNHTLPPFDNPKVRQALQMAVLQSEVIAGIGLPPDLTVPQCFSIFLCGGEYASDAGAQAPRAASAAKARELLKKSGYNNGPVVILNAADSALINPIGLVVAEQARQAGFNVELKSMDWASVNSARMSRQPIGKGGWNIAPIVWSGFDLETPLVHPGTAYNCSDGYPGWYCDPRSTPLLAEFAAERDPARRRQLAAQIQANTHDNVSFILAGQFSAMGAHRADLKDVISMGMPVLWNLRRN